ncbi:TetR/AcrR family transcriptional regulator [Paractinoplanes bogorensis]|uniref:TetR/AcrR family transcriptional regulator n=1 Tax=Paractinoplanes bogorensis TaxID=1610840 RepID=UPI0027DF3337|nr:helix-turn-helix domain-containing protein [Actinoplanes bogorensis]
MRRPPLTREAIVAAARQLAQDGGVEAVTMRRVAAALDCSAMALYRHVTDRDDLLLLALADLAEGIDITVPPGPPADQVQALFERMFTFLRANGWAVDVLRRGELFAPRALHFVELALDALSRGGLPPAEATAGYLALWNFTIGSLCSERPTTSEALARRQSVVDQAPLQQLPHVATALPILDATSRTDAYSHGLRALIRGLLPL